MRSILITGAAQGLGRALVEAFLASGAHVTAFDRNEAALQELQADHEANGSRLLCVAGDVTSASDNQKAVDQALEWAGSLDTYIANAGLWDFSASLELDGDDLAALAAQLFAVNVTGPLLGARAAADALKQAGGSIIVTLSNAALYPGGGGPVYVASKHAALGLVRQLAQELAPQVRVNAVAPTGMRTALTGPDVAALNRRDISSEWDADGFAAHAPLAFIPQPTDYVSPYLLLADPVAGRAITGVVIPCDLGLGVRRLRPMPSSAPPQSVAP